MWKIHFSRDLYSAHTLCVTVLTSNTSEGPLRWTFCCTNVLKDGTREDVKEMAFHILDKDFAVSQYVKNPFVRNPFDQLNNSYFYRHASGVERLYLFLPLAEKCQDFLFWEVTPDVQSNGCEIRMYSWEPAGGLLTSLASDDSERVKFGLDRNSGLLFIQSHSHLFFFDPEKQQVCSSYTSFKSEWCNWTLNQQHKQLVTQDGEIRPYPQPKYAHRNAILGKNIESQLPASQAITQRLSALNVK